MSTLATLVVSLVGDVGDFIKNMERAERQSSGFMDKIGGTLKAGATAGIAALAAVGTAALASAEELDKAYDTIRVSTGATGDDLEGLKKDFESVFTAIPVSAEQASAVIGELNKRLGLTGKPLQDISEGVLELSRLTGGDALTNSKLFGRVMGDWGIPVEGATMALDKFFVAGQKTGVGIDQLMSQVVQFGSPMRLMGFSFEQTIGLFAKWEKEGVNAELVMGSLRIAAGKFAREGVSLQEGLMGTIDTIKNMTDSSAALALGMDVFGARAGPDMVAAIREGRFELGDLVDALKNADGAIMDTAAATEDFPEKFAKMENKVEVLLAPLGMKIMDAIGGAIDWLGPRIEAIIPIFEKIFGTVGKLISELASLLSISEKTNDELAAMAQNGDQLERGLSTLTIATDGANRLRQVFLEHQEDMRQKLMAGQVTLQEYNAEIMRSSELVIKGANAFRDYGVAQQIASQDTQLMTAAQMEAARIGRELMNPALDEGARFASSYAVNMAAVAQGATEVGTSVTQAASVETNAIGPTQQLAEAHKQLADATREAVTGQASLAQSLLEADNARIASAALTELDGLLQSGKITTSQYAEATRIVSIQYGLATEESYAAASALDSLSKLYADKRVTATEFSMALGLVNDAAADGRVSLDELGIKLQEEKRYLDDGILSGEDLARTHDVVGKHADSMAIQLGTASDATVTLAEQADTLSDSLRGIPSTVNIDIFLRTHGEIPALPPGNRAGTQDMQAENNIDVNAYSPFGAGGMAANNNGFYFGAGSIVIYAAANPAATAQAVMDEAARRADARRRTS